jgi:aryl-alcohol dehydrogenase-like predicted oxidoreductase
MEYRKCGDSGLFLSAIGLGCWSFGGGDYWGKQDQKDVDAVVHAAVDKGINFFDTAEVYNDGRSETSLGKAIKGLQRNKLIIGSKVSPSNCYPGVLKEHCEASLKRLQTDYLDVYMIHWPIHSHSLRHFTSDKKVVNNPPDIFEALCSMLKLRDSGKIRYIGLSNFSKKRMIQDIPEYVPVAINELAYNLLSRGIEFDTLPHCKSNNVGILAYIPLMQGILTGKYRTLNDIPELLRRTRHFDSAKNPKSRHGENGFETLTFRAVDDIRSLADRTGYSMTDLAVGWVLANNGITSALLGARNVKQLEEAIKPAGQRLSEEIVNELNIITDDLKNEMGNCFDYWESRENDRTI